tara:strand:+ start:1475 stop:2341 length:867 start_codon:yes stop_codon:yes gene_type:complete
MAKVAKLKVSEIFYSAQGEGRFIGVPSIFLRTFGCNFTCDGFGMARGEKSTERNAVKVELFNQYEGLPLVETGCDSYASWDPRFKHLSPMLEIPTVIERMRELCPGGDWLQENGNDVHIVITGGEPLLGWQRAYPQMIEHEDMKTLRNITFETNGTQLLTEDCADTLVLWKAECPKREITFSVSAKLSASGETWEDAVKPEVVVGYERVGTTYLKFVVEKPNDLDEVDRAVKAYREAGFQGVVYIMPVGGVESVYDGNKFNIADEAMLRGYYYSPRLHVDLWGNSWGK